MKAGLFRVIRPFCIRGERQEADTLVRLDDFDLIKGLLTCGKIDAADDATRAGIRRHEVPQWTRLKNETPGVTRLGP